MIFLVMSNMCWVWEFGWKWLKIKSFFSCNFILPVCGFSGRSRKMMFQEDSSPWPALRWQSIRLADDCANKNCGAEFATRGERRLHCYRCGKIYCRRCMLLTSDGGERICVICTSADQNSSWLQLYISLIHQWSVVMVWSTFKIACFGFENLIFGNLKGSFLVVDWLL